MLLLEEERHPDQEEIEKEGDGRESTVSSDDGENAKQQAAHN